MLILINENQLDEWVRANARDAQGVIVELVWRLVAASCPNPRERRFPLADSIGQHGPDGVLDTFFDFEPFVPKGRSLWEIGTSLGAANKATSDYNKLTEMVPEAIRKESTFIFVTPFSGRRDWEHTWKNGAQVNWLDERLKRGEWKDIRVIDGTKLIDWVHHFPPVELWLARRIIGLSEQQIETPEQHWAILRSIGEPPPLTPDVFLANRAEACAKLKELFDDKIMQLKLATHFPDDVINFISAYLASLDDESRIDTVSRCIIVSGTDAWNKLCTPNIRKLVLIADAALDLSGEAGTILIQKARRAGHAVAFGGPPGGIPDPTSAPLPMPQAHHIQEALIKAGYNEERARTLAQKSNGNLCSLLRCLQNLSLLPAWAEKTEAADLAIAAILGSWSDNSEADRLVVESLSGKSYGEWIGKMREVALGLTTPLIQRDGNWKFVSRYEGWYALGPRLFDEHLDRLKAVALSVLCESDPQFDLPSDERYMASVRGRVLRHSHSLRRGIAESLALLGGHPKALTSCSLGKAEATAALAVRKILANADWVRWASLNDLLPLLAEASPGEFLNAVESALQRDPCPFDEIFAEEGNAVFGRNYMTGLLWALETLAWDEDHLIRVVMCLGELAGRDPGGTWANRPANSLTTILLPWLPQTCAPIPKRVAAVKTLLAELPDVGWKLLVSLLPQYHSASHGTRRPEWRATIPDDWQEGVTNLEYLEQVSAYAELAITEAKKDVLKLAELIDHLGTLPQSAREQLLKFLGSESVLTLPEGDRSRLWEKLIDLITKHRKFADANWAMKPEEVNKIATIAEQLAPQAHCFRHQRLFSEHDSDLFEKTGNYEEQMKDLEVRRQRAVQEILAEGGVTSVIAFAKMVQYPWRVGFAFGAIASLDADAEVLPALLKSDQKSLVQFAGGFVWGRFRNRHWPWVDSIDTSQWTHEQIGQFLSFLPFTLDTWKRAERLLGENQSSYWSHTNVKPYEANEGLETAIDQLIQHRRPYAAIQCLYKMLHDKQPFDNKRAVRALVEALKSSEPPHSIDVYDIVEIIKALQNDPATIPEDLFFVEWAYLPLLDEAHGASPKLLWRRLANDPKFFCEVIRLVFRSKKEEQPLETSTEESEKIAANAYRLLNGWCIPPGLQEDGSYDGEALKAWLEAVKNECAKTSHMEIAMTMVGHVLIHVPESPDGLWIHHSAAEVLNAKDAKNMRDGFSTALYNSRGAHWVDPTGQPERDLALRYQKQAEAVEEAGYHRLATTLRELADIYNNEAQRIVSREPFDE
ncbi:MAG: hypothetical protein QHH14_11950 [Clostridiales bacterium]|jgi:hypothetical protein|nr:hypothetical protein [Clostridiales bacterium]